MPYRRRPPEPSIATPRGNGSRPADPSAVRRGPRDASRGRPGPEARPGSSRHGAPEQMAASPWRTQKASTAGTAMARIAGAAGAQDLVFRGSEEQPGRLAIRKEIAAELAEATGHTSAVIPVTESELGTRATAACAGGTCRQLPHAAIRPAMGRGGLPRHRRRDGRERGFVGGHLRFRPPVDDGGGGHPTPRFRRTAGSRRSSAVATSSRCGGWSRPRPARRSPRGRRGAARAGRDVRLRRSSGGRRHLRAQMPERSFLARRIDRGTERRVPRREGRLSRCSTSMKPSPRPRHPANSALISRAGSTPRAARR
jgi:hypothetical protein